MQVYIDKHYFIQGMLHVLLSEDSWECSLLNCWQRVTNLIIIIIIVPLTFVLFDCSFTICL